MFSLRKGDMLNIMGECETSEDINTWKFGNSYMVNFTDTNDKFINIWCPLGSVAVVEDKIYNQLSNNQNYIDGNIMIEIYDETVHITILDTSTDNVRIDENLNISITKRRRRCDNNSDTKKHRTRVRVGVEFIMLIDEDKIESYGKDNKPVIDEFLKKIRPICTNGVRLTDNICWQTDKDPDFNDSVLDFTM